MSNNSSYFFTGSIPIVPSNALGIVKPAISAYCHAANFGDADWTSSDPADITLTIRMDYAILNY